MKKNLLLILALILLTIASKAQDFEYGTFKQEDLDMKQYDKDTSAHALVLNEHGKASITPVNDDYDKIIYEYHVKIKIFDSKGFDNGNVQIRLLDGSDASETVDNIKGVTTYTDNNGMIKQVELNLSNVYKTKENKDYTLVKFAMPSLKNGCIIEYSYTTYSPFLHYFPHWNFQSDIPKVYSEYDVHIPGFWTYNASIRGNLKLTKNFAEIENQCFETHGAKSDCSHFIFGMSNVPAFIEEEYMTSPNNFISAIYFQLSEWTSPYTGAKTKVAKEWKDVDYDLKHKDFFGAQLKRKDFFKTSIPPLIAGKTDSLDKAKAVYEYIQKNIKWNNFFSIGSNDGIRKVLENHSGNIAEINISLADALNEAGFNAEAVLLSTRDNGFINKLYPVEDEFNYVVVKTDIGGKSYLLDATDPLLPFGTLPLRCLNDQGRVMSLDKPSYWIDMTATPQRENNNYVFDLTLQPDGKIKGTMVHYSIGYEAYEKRCAIKKFNSVDEYVESLNSESSKFKILSSEITNLDSLDLPLSEKYEVEIKENGVPNHDRIGFNPFLIDYITRNPFRLAERNYPVDMGMPSTDRFTLTLHLPDNYTIETEPQQGGIALPNDDGKFQTVFQTDGNSFTFSDIIQFNRSIFSSAEYPYLKELYNKIILAEKTPIMIKKKS